VLLQNQGKGSQQVKKEVKNVGPPPQTVKVKSISSLGLISIEFGNAVKVPAELAGRKLKSLKEAIRIIIQSNDVEKSSPPIDFSWNITDFTEHEMDIQLNFTDTTLISAFSPDVIILQLVDPSYFADEAGSVPTSIFMAQELPRQIKPGSVEEQVLETVTTAGAASQGFVIGNFILSFLMSASLN